MQRLQLASTLSDVTPSLHSYLLTEYPQQVDAWGVQSVDDLQNGLAARMQAHPGLQAAVTEFLDRRQHTRSLGYTVNARADQLAAMHAQSAVGLPANTVQSAAECLPAAWAAFTTGVTQCMQDPTLSLLNRQHRVMELGANLMQAAGCAIDLALLTGCAMCSSAKPAMTEAQQLAALAAGTDPATLPPPLTLSVQQAVSSPPEMEMFSSAGNLAVWAAVECTLQEAAARNIADVDAAYEVAEAKLRRLAAQSAFAEALDSAVTDSVYEVLQDKMTQ